MTGCGRTRPRFLIAFSLNCRTSRSIYPFRMKFARRPPLLSGFCCCSFFVLNFANAQSPTPTPSLEERVTDLEKRLNALESIPAVALALKLRAQTNQTAEASPTPQGDAPLELESWSYQFKRGKYEYENRHVFTYSLKNLTEKDRNRNRQSADGQ